MDDAKRQAFLEAAREVLAANPNASVSTLTAAAGISRATFYRRFPSRDALLAALDIERDEGARDRILAASMELISRDGLARLSMDELSTAAGVSRATLYRLFPGKAVLFRDLVQSYSPFDAVVRLVEGGRHRPPQDLLPELAATVARVVHARVGIVRTLVFEMTSGAPETAQAVPYVLASALGRVGGYLAEQMDRGRVRRMHPLLALQSFVGPILLHTLTRSLLEQSTGLDLPLEEAVVRLAQAWVQGMCVAEPDHPR